MIKEIKIGILFSSRIGDRACGKALLELLEPRYSPKKYNDHEPIGLPYSRSRIEEALQLWGWGFLWRRGKPRMRGSVWTSSDENHDVIGRNRPAAPLDSPGSLEIVVAVAKIGSSFQNIVREHY